MRGRFRQKYRERASYELLRRIGQYGRGRDAGKFMLAGWKSMRPEEHYFKTYTDFHENIEDPTFLKKREEFERC
jgi:hypothetical protein